MALQSVLPLAAANKTPGLHDMDCNSHKIYNNLSKVQYGMRPMQLALLAGTCTSTNDAVGSTTYVAGPHTDSC